MKKLFVLFLIPFLFSCSKDQIATEQVERNEDLISKIKISDYELGNLLAKDKDFSNFIEENEKHQAEFKNRISKLDKESYIYLRDIKLKYKKYDELLKNGSRKELEFFNMLTDYNSKYVYSLEKVFKKLEIYDFSPEAIKNIIINNINSASNSQSYTKDKCQDIWDQVFIEQFCDWVYFSGYDWFTAINYASNAANWAYTGCVMALY
ncbi:MAG TPA: hypothetical protein DIW31_05655 [Bacteroidales bacterium]|nr:hypothetical protein [Bacteroidales bacterium]